MRLIGYFVALFLSLILQSTVFQVPFLHSLEPSLIVIALAMVGWSGVEKGIYQDYSQLS